MRREHAGERKFCRKVNSLIEVHTFNSITASHASSGKTFLSCPCKCFEDKRGERAIHQNINITARERHIWSYHRDRNRIIIPHRILQNVMGILHTHKHTDTHRHTQTT